MSLNRLLVLIPPPRHPVDVGGAEEWVNVQEENGVSLPDDLYDFVKRYGTGEFSGGLEVYNPFSKEYGSILKRRRTEIVEARSRGLNDFIEGDLGYDIDTAPDLLPWGRDDNGFRYWWFMDGPPGAWPTITRTPEYEYQKWDMPLTDLLAGIFGNEIVGLVAPGPFAADKLQFDPAKR